MSVHLTGTNKLKAKLRANTNLDAVKRVVAMNGAELTAHAQRNAPIDTGNLMRSIELDLKDNGLTAVTEAGAEYAAYQEYGTRYMEPQPYMKPAFEAQKGKFISDLNRIMK